MRESETKTLVPFPDRSRIFTSSLSDFEPMVLSEALTSPTTSDNAVVEMLAPPAA